MFRWLYRDTYKLVLPNVLDTFLQRCRQKRLERTLLKKESPVEQAQVAFRRLYRDTKGMALPSVLDTFLQRCRQKLLERTQLKKESPVVKHGLRFDGCIETPRGWLYQMFSIRFCKDAGKNYSNGHCFWFLQDLDKPNERTLLLGLKPTRKANTCEFLLINTSI